MSDRAWRLLGWLEVVVGIAILGYVLITVIGIAQGSLAAGPLRLITTLMNAIAGVALVGLGVITLRGAFRPK